MNPGAGAALLVASAILHAGWNALIKRDPDKTVAAVVVLAASAVVTALAGRQAGHRRARPHRHGRRRLDEASRPRGASR